MKRSGGPTGDRAGPPERGRSILCLMTIDTSWVSQRNAVFLADPAARLAGNAVAATDVERVSLDRAVVTTIDTSVSDLVPDASITDQKRTGRCWAFAGLNVLRAAMIKELELDSLELSQSFPFFYDMLEKANAFLTRVIAEADRPLDDREVVASLHSPIPDGGWWPEFARLVAKYGIVPAYAMPDTVSAGDSDAMNEHLSTLLRRTALRLRTAVADGVDPEPLRVAALEQVHRMLCIHLGAPPSEFVWQYRDKNKKFHRVGALTPLEFAQRYATGVEEFVVLAHDPRTEIAVNTRYGMGRSDVMVGAPVQDHVTAELEVLKAAAIAAIQDGEPVWFACDVAKQRDKEAGIWDAALHDYEGLYGVDLSMTKAERLVTRESALTHAMCLTGVDLINGTARRWRVENSWGDKLGDKGFHTMSDSWFDEYVFEVVVRAGRLPGEVRAALETEPIMLPSWDPMA